MLPTNRVTEHPGETLRQLLEEHGLTQTAFAKHAGMTLACLNEIIAGKRAVTPETAWILGQAFRQRAGAREHQARFAIASNIR
jgi:antitoxin HigA-1